MFRLFGRPGGRVVLGFVIVFCLILGCIFVAEKVYDAQSRVAHHQQIEQVLRILLIDLLDSEAGQRGFLLTGEQSYLDPYRTGNLNAMMELARLNVLCQSPQEVDFFTGLQPLVEHKLAEIDETIRIQAVDPPRALQIVKTGVGRNDMVIIRAMFRRHERDSFVAEAHDSATLHRASMLLLGLIGLTAFGLLKLSELLGARHGVGTAPQPGRSDPPAICQLPEP